jgi:hypothetical protein
LGKIAENCDHNIDPRLGEFMPFGLGIVNFEQLYENARCGANCSATFSMVQGIN